jgi:hypothetical protein
MRADSLQDSGRGLGPANRGLFGPWEMASSRLRMWMWRVWINTCNLRCFESTSIFFGAADPRFYRARNPIQTVIFWNPVSDIHWHTWKKLSFNQLYYNYKLTRPPPFLTRPPPFLLCGSTAACTQVHSVHLYLGQVTWSSSAFYVEIFNNDVVK